MFLPLHNLLNPAEKVIILLAHKWLPEASESFTLLRPRKAARWVPASTLHPPQSASHFIAFCMAGASPAVLQNITLESCLPLKKCCCTVGPNL